MTLFFLSHEGGTNEPPIRRFYVDLCAEVDQYLGRGPESALPGYMDNWQPDGNGDWPADRITALQTCRAFVALCSPKYFGSAVCGREWGFFQRRLAARPATDQNAPALLPLVWLPSRVPAAARPYNYDDPDFTAAYRERGLRDLIRFKRFEDEYLEFVTVVGRRLASLQDSAPPPELSKPDPYHQAWNAFAGPAPAPRARTPRPATFPHLNLDSS